MIAYQDAHDLLTTDPVAFRKRLANACGFYVCGINDLGRPTIYSCVPGGGDKPIFWGWNPSRNSDHFDLVLEVIEGRGMKPVQKFISIIEEALFPNTRNAWLKQWKILTAPLDVLCAAALIALEEKKNE